MKHTKPAKRRSTGHPANFTIRIICFGMIWTILSSGRMESWIIGGPAVLLAAWVSGKSRAFRATGFSFAGGLRFMGFFLKASLISGLDVVRRAFHPKLLLQPDLIDYRLSLVTDVARVFMADAVSLLPGTLSAHLVEANLTIHVLDRNTPVREELRALEKRVAAMLEPDDRPMSTREGDVR